MEHDLSSQAQRGRLAQFFAWVRGEKAQTEQAQAQKSDRQMADGYLRGNDDPDARRASRQGGGLSPGTNTPALTWDQYREHVRTREAAQTLARLEEARHPSGNNAVSRAAEAEMRQAEALAARLAEAQQRRQNRQQGRGR